MPYSSNPAFGAFSHASALRLRSRAYQRSLQRPISSSPTTSGRSKKKDDDFFISSPIGNREKLTYFLSIR